MEQFCKNIPEPVEDTNIQNLVSYLFLVIPILKLHNLSSLMLVISTDIHDWFY